MTETDAETRKVKLRVTGMTCAMCVQTIESSLKDLDGVKAASVNLGSETAMVEYDPAKLKVADLERSVTEVGYGVVRDRARIRVGGMHCASCVATIEDVLGTLDGVSSITVNLGTEKVQVDYDPQVVTLKQMRRAITDAGYEWLGAEEELSEEQERALVERDLAGKRDRAIVGIGVGGGLMAVMQLHIDAMWMPWAMLAVAAPAFAYTSASIFIAAFRSLRHRVLNMDVMYSMGIGVAFVASVLATVGVLPMEFQFYETALMLAGFLMIGRWLEARAKGKTSEAIKKLIGLRPKTATVIRDGVEVVLPIEEVRVGDVVVVRPGERVPTDGEVVEGQGHVDESMITGEPVPPLRAGGDAVVGGTINVDSMLKLKASRVGKDTVLAQIIALVEEAQGSKPQIQRLADRAVAWFIPVILAIAISSFLVWFVVVGETALFSVKVLIAILVIACPCALGLATPTAITVGVGRGAELGILIKSGDALERPERLSMDVFDKTGTLTRGRPDVTDVVPVGMGNRELLELAGSVERGSLHPLAKAIVNRALAAGANLEEPKGLETFEGMGVAATVGGSRVLVGNRALMEAEGVDTAPVAEAAARLESEAKTVVLVARDGRAAGAIAIADSVRPSSREAIAQLRRMGLEVAMITGDNRKTAEAIASQIGITRVLAQVLPQDKAKEVKRLQEGGAVVAFVGDGINDAPALAQSDVGIAIGGGTDVAVESADIVLMKDDPVDAVAAVQLSRKVMRRIKENLFWAFAYNTALVPLAAGLFYPLFGITFRPELAGLAMALSSVTVVSLSLMLKGYVPPSRMDVKGVKR